MSDYTSITVQGNTGSDASPTWGTAISFGGTSGANEKRFITAGSGGGTTIPSASWAASTRPLSSTAAVDECYIYTSDASGYKVATYNGGRTNSLVFRLVFDALGTMASAARLTAFASTAHAAPSRGTQIDNPTDGSNIINGASPDTG